MSIRTVLGDIEPESLGPTYMHEHLILDSPFVADRMPEILLDSVDKITQELVWTAEAGLGAVVDAAPCAVGRDAIRMAAVSEATGVHVVACTGLHTGKWYQGQRWAMATEPEELAALFIADIEEGIDRNDYTGPVVERTSHRAGIVKVATLGTEPDARERRLFEAAAYAHRVTGAPLLTHCEAGTGALAQIALLTEFGVDLDKVMLSHTDKVHDMDYHQDILESGVCVEYDQALRQADDTPPAAVRLIVAMVEAGFVDRIMLGTDGARRSLLRSYGGRPGLAYLLTDFSEQLSAAGVAEATQRSLFIANPARFLTMSDTT